MSMEKNLKEFLEELIQEVEKELDEATATGAVAGYQTPMAFSDKGKSDKKRKKKIATSMGYSVVGNDVDNISESSDSEIKKSIKKNSKGGPYSVVVQKGNMSKHISHSQDVGNDVDKTIKVYNQFKKKHRAGVQIIDGYGKTVFFESVSENFTPEQAYNGLFNFKHKGKKYVGKVVRKDGGKYVLSLHDIGLLSIPGVSPNDMEYLGNVSDQGKKGLPYLSAHPKNFQKVQNGQFYKELAFKGGLKFSLPTYLSDSQLKDINKYYRLKLTKDDLKLESVNENAYKTWLKKNDLDDNRDNKSLYHHLLKKYKSVSKFPKHYNESVNEAKVKRPINRWLELKNDESMHPHKKMAMGLKELKYQLRETEKFFNWYNKIKTMNELDSNQYWKRTNKHIYSIKEKLINIAKTIQEIEK